MKKKSSKLVTPIVVSLLVIGVVFFLKGGDVSQRNAQLSTIQLQKSGGKLVELEVEIADENEERQHGLMGRSNLDEGTGMLFIFDQTQPLYFWMKNTLIPLDILFFDGEGSFVSRATMLPCTTNDCPSYGSGGGAKYALEVNAGEAETEDVGEGWKLLLE